MLVSRRLLLAFGASLLVCTSLAASALASPITVNVRVEGSTKTLFEGPVNVEPIADPPGIETASSEGSHPCDVKDNGENGGFAAAGAPPTAALYDAAIADGLEFDASWYESLHDFDVSQVGEDIADSGGNNDYWGYAINYTTGEVGGCQIRLAPGSEVLWAYNFFGLPHLLSLSGSSNAQVGVPYTVHVVDGQTGQPIEGASIGEDVGGVTTTIPSSPQTDANGYATITPAHAGTFTLKATQPESVRSNGLAVTVSAAPCNCAVAVQPAKSTPPDLIDLARVEGVKDGKIYSAGAAPRLLAGTVSVPAGGTLRQVRISLKRRYRGRCFGFSGSREKFTRLKCSRSASFFSVGSSESFSYLLPAKLPAGLYTYEIEAVDASGRVTQPKNGVSRVVFRVK